ncbi:MAG: hypothetical protein HYV08_16840 [Deltaproteobacteria bacterium]|nr:hypothetical protein [Deltaproteobacteria bacterium]
MKVAAAVLAFLVGLIGAVERGDAQPIKMWTFRATSPNGGVLEGTVKFQPLGAEPGSLIPQGTVTGATAIRVLGVLFMSGRGSTGSDGSFGALWSDFGITCTNDDDVHAVATPHYASGQARFAMIGGRDRFGVTIWVGLADGLGLDGAKFDLLASCAGTASF